MMNDKELQQLLQGAFVPDGGMERDRWPEMGQRLQRQSAALLWFEWALGALALALLFVSPTALPLLLNWL